MVKIKNAQNVRMGFSCNKATKRKLKHQVEKREAQRLSINWVVKYRITKKEKTWNKANTEDLSGKGLRLIIDRPLKNGCEIDISFSLSKKSQSLHILCSVIWCRKDRDNKYKAGLAILKVSNLTAFLNFMGEKMLELHPIKR